MMSSEMVEWIENGSKVMMSENLMTAELYLCPPPDNMKYDVDTIIQVLAKNGVRRGIREERVKKMLEDEIYFAKVVVAFGQPPEEGQEGRFEFFLNQ